ncbi:hypothetical protein K7B10_38050 [Streptomyces flavotricini]|uniref:Uncharacterized protein n=1 Tax=Streptomyces flavotricini TaxID=66888 RepID=A0ABS8EH49_9ACTN|nr:hypothetical protein [Streptomyces flavotricini]MCC0100475.1 hypothetical protein [Streptomyces flavotricini]
MTAPDEHDLPAAIRRDHRDGDKLPSSLAARHQVSREYVMNALSLIAPQPGPVTETEQRACQERLDELLAEDAAKSPEQRRDVFGLYQALVQSQDTGVSYQWVWDHVRAQRHGQAADSDAPADPLEPAGRNTRSWGSCVSSDMPSFVTDLITHAVRHLTELRVAGSMPAAEGAELAMASLGAAHALIGQAMNEVALVGRAGGVPWTRLSRWADTPQDELAQRVQEYQRTVTL